VEYRAKYLIHSKKQRLFLIVYEFSGVTNEVVLYWENSDAQVANSKSSTVKGTSNWSTLFSQQVLVVCDILIIQLTVL